jgi:membrane protease YdiL (CAAX protease family)
MSLFSILSYISELINLGFIGPYIMLLGEITSSIYVIKKVCLKRGYKIELGNKPTWKGYSCILLFVAGYILVYDNTFELLLSSIERADWMREAFNQILKNPFSAFLSITIVAPVIEEIIFRAVILKQLLKKYGILKPIIVSALLFGVVHGNIHQGVTGFLIGIMLGIIYVHTRSLLLCIIAHSMNNLFWLLVEYYFPIYKQMMVEFNLIQLLVGIFIIIASYWSLTNLKVNSDKKFGIELK